MAATRASRRWKNPEARPAPSANNAGLARVYDATAARARNREKKIGEARDCDAKISMVLNAID
jgi:hypothetical protein